MVNTCAVPLCKNPGTIEFPKDPFFRKAWCIAIRRCHETRKTLWKPSYYHKLCRTHFKTTDFAPTTVYRLGASTNRNRFRLKKDAIPSIFSWSKKPASRTKADQRAQTIDFEQAETVPGGPPKREITRVVLEPVQVVSLEKKTTRRH